MRNFSLKFHRGYAISLLCLVVGCTVYQPPNIPAQERATIGVEPAGSFWRYVEIIEIDGAKASLRSAVQLGHAPSDFAIAPGKHRCWVKYQVGNGFGMLNLWLVAEAGHAYRLKSESRGYEFSAWFYDSDSKARVGGIVGSEDEPHQ